MRHLVLPALTAACLTAACLTAGCKSGVDTAAEAQALTIRATEIVEPNTPPHVDPSYAAPAGEPWPCTAPRMTGAPGGGEGRAAVVVAPGTIVAPEAMTPPAGAALGYPLERPLSPADAPFADVENRGKRVAPPQKPVSQR